jgi:dipeptidyl aminopeptidase/acylaminoacyl peptidase
MYFRTDPKPVCAASNDHSKVKIVRSALFSLLTFLFLVSIAKPQFSVITPPAGVLHQGIPLIPTSIGIESYPYRAAPGSALVGWDPTKLEMIASSWGAGAKSASRISAPAQPPVSMMELPDWDRDMLLDPGGNYLVYVKPADENFQDQIYRYDIKTKITTLLTDGKSRNRYPVFSNSGKLLAYSSNRRDGKNMDVFVTDTVNPKSNRMIARLEGEDWAVFDWSPDDTKVLLSDWRSVNESYLWLLDIKSGRKTPLTPPGAAERIFNGSYAYFRKNAKGIYFITDRDSEFRRLAYLDFTGGQFRFLADRIQWDIDEIALSPDGKILAFVSNEDGIGRLRLIDTETSKEIPVPEMPAGIVSRLMWHRKLPYLGFQFSSTRSPSEVYSINANTGKLEQWTISRNPVKTDEFREPELVRWKSFDERMISGFLYRPPAFFTGKRPVIINIHGGPPEQFRPNYLGEANYYIHHLGVAMLYPNARGSTGYGKTFLKLDDTLHREDVTKDIGSLLDWIANEPGLDSNRVMVQGISYGGYVALSAAEAFSARICALLTYLAPTNLATFVERNPRNDQDSWRRELGDERDPEVRKYLETIAPVNGAAKILTPTFLSIGKQDLMTSREETERIITTLKESGIPAWYLLAQEEGHNFRNPRVYQYKFGAEALFVKKYLLGEGN